MSSSSVPPFDALDSVRVAIVQKAAAKSHVRTVALLDLLWLLLIRLGGSRHRRRSPHQVPQNQDSTPPVDP